MKKYFLNEGFNNSMSISLVKKRKPNGFLPYSSLNKTISSYPTINRKLDNIKERNMKESFIQQQYQLQQTINKLNNELRQYKSENVYLASELNQRQRQLENMILITPHQQEKMMESIVVSKMKAELRGLKYELEKKNKESYVIHNERDINNEQKPIDHNDDIDNQYKTINTSEMLYAKEMITKQHGIIRILEDKQRNYEAERRLNKKEMDEMGKTIETKSVSIVKLENDLESMEKKYKKPLKEEVEYNDWINEKKDLQKRLKEMEENLYYYKNKFDDNSESKNIIGNKTNIKNLMMINQPISIQVINTSDLAESTDKELNYDNKDLKPTSKVNKNNKSLSITKTDILQFTNKKAPNKTVHKNKSLLILKTENIQFTIKQSPVELDPKRKLSLFLIAELEQFTLKQTTVELDEERISPLILKTETEYFTIKQAANNTVKKNKYLLFLKTENIQFTIKQSSVEYNKQRKLLFLKTESEQFTIKQITIKKYTSEELIIEHVKEYFIPKQPKSIISSKKYTITKPLPDNKNKTKQINNSSEKQIESKPGPINIFLIQFEDILLINLASKNVNQSTGKRFFATIVNEDNVNEFPQEDFISQITDTISNILGCSTNQNDKDKIYAFYTQMYDNDGKDNFVRNFNAFLDKTNVFYKEDNAAIIKEIKKEISKHTDIIEKTIKLYPDTIDISDLLETFALLDLKLRKEALLFLLYQMKKVLPFKSLICRESILNLLMTAKLEDYLPAKNQIIDPSNTLISPPKKYINGKPAIENNNSEEVILSSEDSNSDNYNTIKKDKSIFNYEDYKKKQDYSYLFDNQKK